MLKEILNDGEQRMNKVIEFLQGEYSGLRAGRANPALVEKIMVDYYGSPTPLNQTANISCPEPRLIVIQPWDKSLVPTIEKAILKSDLGINPNSDGVVIRLAIPQLTEERRKELVKTCSKKAEEARVSIRNVRRDLNDEIKAVEKAKECSEDESKKALDDAQKLTDKLIKRVDEIFTKKEKEIMEV
ncbi:MAG: ribosome recycling factor [Firmicutes bacterium]|nr:ribosome recycling factor [Bacillota bacterium]MBQ6842094.1 ribosome recycling factor [Bacillota bacterium]